MPRQAREKSTTGIYHVMLRGTNRQIIFHDDEDRTRFLETVLKAKAKSEIRVYAWCIMSNHIHLLLREGIEDLSVTIKRIGVSYVWYYNRKYNTVGHLFQDRYKSEAVERDSYLLTVLRYIHQNPVKAQMVQYPSQWKWSSCLAYYGNKAYPEGLLDSGEILAMFAENVNTARRRFKQFNEEANDDCCLDEHDDGKKRLTDEEAKQKMLSLLTENEMAKFKSLPKEKRDEILQAVKRIEGLSQRQVARILGISPTLVFKA